MSWSFSNATYIGNENGHANHVITLLQQVFRELTRAGSNLEHGTLLWNVPSLSMLHFVRSGYLRLLYEFSQYILILQQMLSKRLLQHDLRPKTPKEDILPHPHAMNANSLKLWRTNSPSENNPRMNYRKEQTRNDPNGAFHVLTVVVVTVLFFIHPFKHHVTSSSVVISSSLSISFNDSISSSSSLDT